LLGRETRPRTQIGEMALGGTRPDPHQFGRNWDRPTSFNERGKDVHLALRRWPREGAAQVPVSHANRLAAAIHSSRPSIGIS
jgi:hypothetical protein